MAHVVILGAGIGGMPAACELRELLPKEHRINLAGRPAPAKGTWNVVCLADMGDTGAPLWPCRKSRRAI